MTLESELLQVIKEMQSLDAFIQSNSELGIENLDFYSDRFRRYSQKALKLQAKIAERDRLQAIQDLDLLDAKIAKFLAEGIREHQNSTELDRDAKLYALLQGEWLF